MNDFVTYRHGSDEFDAAIKGFVMAERVNDVVARPNSKRYREYLQRIQDEFVGEPHSEMADQYRDAAKELLPRAIDAFETKHDVELQAERVYLYPNKFFRLACAPDAVESDLVGFTVHVRQSKATYLVAAQEGVTHAMERVAQASMIVTGLRNWIHLDYFEDAGTRTRKLYEHLVEYDKRSANDVMSAMLAFLAKSRFRATEVV